ncbi:MAG: gliding motility-associated C-terminal domain-containing protein, partial [Saprospiraceae bacterium]|nr:gliding motility-associated C-terminal domain-containing protein [Saprospiraceae bacterium]
VQDFHLQVFSRWGALVFETADFTDWWDGTTDGIQQAASGVYVWIMRFEIRDRNYYFEGDVTLMR